MHIDKGADFTEEIIKRDNVFVLPNSKRVKCAWAQISLVDATLNMLDYAKSNRGGVRLLLADERARLAY